MVEGGGKGRVVDEKDPGQIILKIEVNGIHFHIMIMLSEIIIMIIITNIGDGVQIGNDVFCTKVNNPASWTL